MTPLELEKDIDITAGYGQGVTLLVSAIAALLIDKGVLPKDELVKALALVQKTLIREEDRPVVGMPFEQCLSIIENTDGAGGHMKVLNFHLVREFLQKLNTVQPKPESDANSD